MLDSEPFHDAQERDKVVREVMRLMLFKQHSKADQPVRRQEISDRINAVTAHRPASLGSYVIKQVRLAYNKWDLLRD